MAKEKTVRIRLPLLKNEENQEVFVAVNGKRFKIKRGVPIDVPEYIEEALRHSEEQDYLVEELKRAAEAESEKEDK